MAISCFDPFVQGLIKSLGLPKMTRRFSLHVATDSDVIVEAEYYPDPKDWEKLVTKRFVLVEIDPPAIDDKTYQRATNWLQAIREGRQI